jgi:hypothetical protein
MIKFLIYLFIFYILFRLIFGRFTGVKTRVYRFDTHHHHYHNGKNVQQEGKITVNPKVNKTSKGTSENGKIGEYVDYEEVE